MNNIGWRDVTAPERDSIVTDWLLKGLSYRISFAESRGGGVDVCYVFSASGGDLHGLRLHTAYDGTVPTLVDLLPAVHWDEREIQDMFGLRFDGHPDPRPLMLPDAYSGPPPMAPGGQHREQTAWNARSLEQEGTVLVPVGPVHAGVIESGHFLFSTVGETVLQMDARLSWNHRGIEQNLEGRDIGAALRIVERTCGSCSASHQEAFSEAVEQIADVQLPAETMAWRGAILEMERIYNHLNDLGQLATGVALAVLAQQGLELKERALRLQGNAFGHRYLFGSIRPGTVSAPRDSGGLQEALLRLRDDSVRWADRLFANTGFRDRLTGIGRVGREDAASLGAVGPVARASGIAVDVRCDRPYGAYRSAPIRVEQADGGDAMARAEIRRRELDHSFALATGFLKAGGPAAAVPIATDISGHAIAIVESPRGAEAQFLRLSQGRVERLHLRSASFANWPLIMVAAADNPIGDFPLINKSFELCYACCDR